MKTGKNRMFKRNISRFLSFIMIISVLSTYGCNKGKTIDPNFYPTAVESGSETQETSKETKTEKTQVSDEEILKPEKDTFRETGKFEYNPAVIPNWVLEEAKDKPQLIRVAKDALVAINNCDTEFTIDEDLKLTENDIQILYYIIYYSTPLYAVVLLGAHLVNDDLLGLAVLQNLSLDLCAFDCRSAELAVVLVDYSDDLVKYDLVFSLNRKRLNKNSVALLDAILLSACFDNCVHCDFTSYLFRDSLSGAEHSSLAGPFKAA